jgi:hypothetical protein
MSVGASKSGPRQLGTPQPVRSTRPRLDGLTVETVTRNKQTPDGIETVQDVLRRSDDKFVLHTLLVF